MHTAPQPADTDWIAQYIDHVQYEKRLAQRTVTLYRADLQRLQTYCTQAHLALNQVQANHIRQWVATLHGAGHNPRGIARILSSWRGFYRWLQNNQYIQHQPLHGVRAPKADKPLPKALAVDDAVRLADFVQQSTTAPTNNWQDIRNQLIIELLYGSGLRIGELVSLDTQPSPQAQSWLDLDDAQAHILGKGNKRRSVPLSRIAVERAKQWLQIRATLPKMQQTPALISGRNGTRLSAQAIWQQLRQRSQQAGLPVPVHPHMLRHSFASHLLQSSGDLRAVQELLGHADISSTQIYTRLDFQHLAKVYDKTHPRAQRKDTPDTPPKPHNTNHDEGAS